MIHPPFRPRAVARLLALPLAAIALAGAACGGSAPPAPATRAALVVDPGDGQVVTRCVSFPGPAATGLTILERSGLPLAYDATASLGTLVCSVAGTGCDFPRESCLCRCAGGGEDCRFWSYWRQDPGGAWREAPAGADAASVAAGSVEGWRFGDGRSPPPPARFDEICSGQNRLVGSLNPSRSP